MGRVKGKKALITGASRGIGAATARLLHQEGARLILADLRDEEGRTLAKELGATFVPMDVSHPEAWENLNKMIAEKWGSLDILFNNAGITGFDADLGPQDPENATLQAWQHVHRINLDSVFLGCKHGIALMKQDGGSIINMSSRSGMVGVSGAAAYASSKAAVRNHTKTVALYCAEKGYGIRCNSLHPGAILTPMWHAMLGQDEHSRKQAITHIAQDIPLKRMGSPLDVAYAVLYLASDEAAYLTGAEFTIDGGILAGSTAPPKKD